MGTQYFLFHVLNTVRSLQSPAGELAISERRSTHKPKPPEIEHSPLGSRLLFYRAGIAVRSRTDARATRDMPVSSFVLGLVFVGLALVAYADRPPQAVPLHPFNGVKRVASPTALVAVPTSSQGAHKQGGAVGASAPARSKGQPSPARNSACYIEPG